MTATDTPQAEQPEFDLTALGHKAATRTKTKLKEDTDESVGNASMHLSSLLRRLSGKSRLVFAQMFEALLEEAAESNDPEAFMDDLMNGSAPVDRNSVAYDLRDELTLLDNKRADESHEVGAAVALFKKMVKDSFGPEATTVGTPQPWQIIHRPAYGSVPAIFVALQESNSLLLTALTDADALVPAIETLRDMKYDTTTMRPFNDKEPMVHPDTRTNATDILNTYQQAAEAARRALPTTGRQQGALGNDNN